jgi:hypothetical protein
VSGHAAHRSEPYHVVRLILRRRGVAPRPARSRTRPAAAPRRLKRRIRTSAIPGRGPSVSATTLPTHHRRHARGLPATRPVPACHGGLNVRLGGHPRGTDVVDLAQQAVYEVTERRVRLSPATPAPTGEPIPGSGHRRRRLAAFAMDAAYRRPRGESYRSNGLTGLDRPNRSPVIDVEGRSAAGCARR